MRGVRDIIRAIFWSYAYNRDIGYMVDLCQEVLERVHGAHISSRWTDDGNILYGTIVLLWGNYGTSPRGGWLEEHIHDIGSCIMELIDEYKEMEKEENEDAE